MATAAALPPHSEKLKSCGPNPCAPPRSLDSVPGAGLLGSLAQTEIARVLVEDCGHQALGHHVADHLVAIAARESLGIARHALAERGVLVLQLVERGEEAGGGIDRPIEGILGGDGHFLAWGDASETEWSFRWCGYWGGRRKCACLPGPAPGARRGRLIEGGLNGGSLDGVGRRGGGLGRRNCRKTQSQHQQVHILE